jgi:hypothetical protein
MDSTKIKVIIIAVIATIAALYLGIAAATAQTEVLIWGAGCLFLIVCLLLGRNIWLLVPLFYGINTSLRILPGGISLRDLAVVGVGVVMLLQIATRQSRFRIKFDTPTIGIIILIAFVTAAYIRNPTGLAVFGSGSVGGRPYFEMGLAFLAFAMLSTKIAPAGAVGKIALLTIFGSLATALLQIVSFMIPAIGNQTTKIFAFLGTGLSAGVSDEASFQGRRGYLKDLVPPSLTMILARHSPTVILRNFKLFYILASLFLLIIALYSGYRSLIVWSAFMTAAAFLIRREGFALFMFTIFGTVLVGLLLPIQGNLIDLPQPAQRALSFLPADWDPDVKANADFSSRWRFEMWEQVLTTDRYIQDKLWGDGFGFSKREFELQMNMLTRGWMTDEEHQEYYMMTGGYHSGPVETVRRVGYIGLFFLLCVQIAIARYAWRVIRRFQGTPWFFSTMVIGLPLVVHPFDFCFVFGTFKDSVILMCFGTAFLKMIVTAVENEQPALAEAPR